MSVLMDQLSSELYQRGREAMDLHKYEEAAALFRSSVELRPHFKALELLGECLLEGEHASSEAIVVLAAAAGLGNQSSRSLFLLAKALSLTGNLQDAIQKLDLAIEINPQFKAAILLRSDLRARSTSGGAGAQDSAP
jgi:tetratricopeptide (TPR) repeat protein